MSQGLAVSVVDHAVAILQVCPPASAELLDVLSSKLGVSPAALEAACLADPRLEVVCRPEGMMTWDHEHTDSEGRVHYGLTGQNAAAESVFIRMR